jgi:23S rRNA pseudouridine2605 synthase
LKKKKKMKTRLNKFLAGVGVASRRKADDLIATGRVEVNKQVVVELGCQIDPEHDVVHVDGELVKYAKRVYYLLNKPKGYVTTTSDEKGRPTVLSLVPAGKGLFPVGRLDLNTTGVLLITNDGDFANLVLHPSFGKKRVYVAKLSRAVTPETGKRLLKGIQLEGRQSRFIEFELLAKDGMLAKVSTLEGRNHFVKKMFEKVGVFVTDLQRESFAGFTLNDIPVGGYRVISDSEIERIKA